MNLDRFLAYDTFRVGQKELAASVHDACTNGDRLVVEAMSGFGKTAAVLCGALLAAEEKDLRIVYLCRTKRQISRVTEELSDLQRKVQIPSAYLFSKFDYCLLRKHHPYISPESFKWYCNFNVTNNLCSYFLNVSFLSKKMEELSRASNQITTHQALLEKSQQLHVCPYEIARIRIANARIMTATYHYLFEEASRSLFLASTQLDPRRTILVFDEAHNLRDFIRDSKTSTISFSELERAVEESQALFFGKVSSSISLLFRKTKEFCEEHPGWHLDKRSFVSHLNQGIDDSWLSNLALELTACASVAWHSISVGSNPPLSVLRVGKFLSNLLASLKEDDYILAKSASSITLVNANPGKSFLTATDRFKSTILLSATVNPSEFFLKSLGLQHASVKLHAIQPAASLKIKTIIDVGVTTKFKTRSTEMYHKIAEKIVAAIRSSKRGIGVFVPSYIVLESLREEIQRSTEDRIILVEERGLTNQRATEIMTKFKSTPGSILLAVQGGRFSEGEDFRDDQMDISIVVGLALPPPSPLMYAEYAFLRRTDPGSSYMMISLLPALRKAFQSAGRHIRNPNKRGMVLLLDSRFNNSVVLSLMPSWLKQDLITGDFTSSAISQVVDAFEATFN